MMLKTIIRAITLLPLATYIVFCCFHVMLNDMRPTYLDCGRVVSKSNDEVAIKHGTRTELYLNIQFEKSGFRSIETNPTTYFSSEVGKYMCFNLNKDTSFWYQLNGMVGIFALFVLGVVILCLFIWYIFPDNWWKL